MVNLWEEVAIYKYRPHLYNIESMTDLDLKCLKYYEDKFDSNPKVILSFMKKILAAHDNNDINELKKIFNIFDNKIFNQDTKIALSRRTITTHPSEKKIDIWDADNQLVDRERKKKSISRSKANRNKCRCK